MVTETWEFVETKRVIRLELERLIRAGLKPPSELKIGAMIEVPSLLFELDYVLPECDFVSIGSNDLIMVEGLVTFAVAEGAAFVPRLFEKLGVAIRSVTVQQPSLDDVFLNFTGTSLRDAEAKGGGFNPAMAARRGR